MARVLITGGSGYVGSNIAKELVRIGCEAIVLFDLVPPKHQYCLSLDVNNNSKDINSDSKSKVVYVRGDICNYDSIDNAMKVYGINAVYHVAGYGLSGDSNLPAYDYETNMVNVFGTENVVKASLNNEVTALGK